MHATFHAKQIFLEFFSQINLNENFTREFRHGISFSLLLLPSYEVHTFSSAPSSRISSVRVHPRIWDFKILTQIKQHQNYFLLPVFQFVGPFTAGGKAKHSTGRQQTFLGFNLLLICSRIQIWFVSVLRRKIWLLWIFYFLLFPSVCFHHFLLASFLFFSFFTVSFYPLFIHFSISFLSSSWAAHKRSTMKMEKQASFMYNLLWYGDVVWDLKGGCV